MSHVLSQPMRDSEAKVTEAQNSVGFLLGKMHTENQPPSLLNSRDGYEEDLKIQIWVISSYILKINHLACLILEKGMNTTLFL